MALALNYGLNFRTYKLSGWGHPNLQIGAIIVLIFATIEECSQYYIPSRTFDLGDLLADFVGVVLFSIWRKK
jgi:VanZ family protein